jgi:hypothetical protein
MTGQESPTVAPGATDRHEIQLDTVPRTVVKLNPEDYPNNDGDVVEASLATSLRYDDLVLVVWHTNDTVFSADFRAIGPELFDLINSGHCTHNALVEEDPTKQTISIEEMEKAFRRPDVVKMIDEIGCPVLRFLSRADPGSSKVHEAFMAIDTDNSGDITRDEWFIFLKVKKQ